MDDPPSYLSLSYGDPDVVEDSQRIMGALRTIVGYVNSLHINLHSSPIEASLAQAVVDFTRETFNGDLGTTPTLDNILPICAVAELFTAEDDTIRRPKAISQNCPDPLCLSPPAWSDHGGAGDNNIVMTLAEPARSSHRNQDKEKGRADKHASTPAPPQPRPPAKKPVVPNQRPSPVPPSSTHPAHLAPRSYADTACKAAPIKQPALLAAPPSRPPSRKGRKIPDYTAHGPSRRQLLIDVGDHAKDANLTTLFKDLSSDVLSRQGLRVKVLVPSEHDTDILRGMITSHFKVHYKFTPWVGMPTSKLFLQIVDIPRFQGTHYDLDHLTDWDEVASALKALSHLVSISHTVWRSPHRVVPSGYEPVQRALASPSALGAGGGVIPLVAAMWPLLNVRTALVLTSWRSTAPLHLVAKGIQRQTPCRVQRLLGSHALISLAAPTVERITVPMNALACSGVTEPPWRFVRTAPSTSRKSGDDVIGTPLHPAWLPMVRIPKPDSRPRVMAYVSNRLKEFHPLMRHDLIDHCDVLILSLFANGQSYNLMNVYSDETHMAALLLAEEAASLPLFIYMGGDFNIHSQEWDGGHRGHPGVATQLLNTVAELGLQQAPFVNLGPTFYPRIQGFRSTVIDLVFVQLDQTLTAQVTQMHNAMGESDHILLATTLLISADSGATPRRALKADREEQICFVRVIKGEFAMKVDEHAPLNTPDQIDAVAQAIADSFSAAWETCSREVTIMRRSKLWWTDECSVALQAYWEHGLQEDWKLCRKAVKNTKWVFFDSRITEISITNKRTWDLMLWVQQRKLPLCEAIQYQGQPCHALSQLWDALHNTYNSVSDRPFDIDILGSIPDMPVQGWVPFSALEM
ncbi:hypothetical protein CVT25_012159 [Psilocybe cyanescens]|uniref:Endonuclease/exonuclease/phosphatase domain-containing protein n=1 Tax=Psilocybe cyanescens TaxID=93625 RepID=A0A409XJ76_PSICY|nr:hypothetical protein CVT25_012159 [Psilocybe cyanescens]